ncbi:hypothetical protein MTX78_09225 [Hymenobacter tibetensis]|uniref:Uncharacterized protein n=1 Tax=Hymenobacter tibetensis TaxID=497967 RepID=A0ABY4D6B6_9BACT|nr:hypothetical protein [Hymenobacter tibetensis]UOG76766.1 hypothetical protein MTX78_09225 [Hymenobacter tibetensis]
MFDKIKDNLSLATVFLIVISLARLITYYQIFGVNIADYIELSEILSLLSDYLLFQFAVALIYLFIIVYVQSLFTVQLIDSLKPPKPNPNPTVPIVYKPFELPLVLGMVLLCIGGMVYVTYLGQGKVVLAGLGLLALCIFIDQGVGKIEKMFRKEDSEENAVQYNTNLRKSAFTSSVLLIFLLLNIAAGFVMAKIKMIVDMEPRVTIEYEGKLIRASTQFIHIGRVKNYTFFYNKQTGYTHAYPNSGIKRVYMR